MGWSAFRPEGNTIAITPLLVSTTPAQAPSYGGEPWAGNYLVSNTTSQGCFLAIGNQSVVVAIPTGAGTSSANGFWIPPLSQASYTFGPGSYFAAICPSGTTTLYITPGDGL